MKIRDFILIFLSSRTVRCATLDEIVSEVVHRRLINAKNPRLYVIKILGKMVRAGLIRRTWIQFPNPRRRAIKKRYYCVRGVA